MGSRAGGNRFSRDPAPPCGSHEEKRPIVNEDEPRMNTKTDGPPSAASGTKMHLQFCALAVTMLWDDGFLGARASRPHQACHSLAHPPHLDQPGTAPWLSFGLSDAVHADRVAACSIALKLSGGQRDRMRAGRPRSQAMPSRWCGGGCPVGDFSESRRTPFGKLPFARKPCPATPCGSFEEKRPIINEDEPRINTNRPEDRWTCFNGKRH